MAHSMLILGGTRFVGRALAEAALSADIDVTLFNRGVTAPELFPDARHLRGDRLDDVNRLAEGTWDVAIDVAAYEPRAVDLAVGALRGRVERYLFVSTLSVYADHSTRQREDEPVLRDDSYGGKKAACEEIVRQAFGDRSLIARPGLIVGPHDPTDRFAYWPRRIAAGGVVLAPGAPSDPLQFVDVRDLGSWLLRVATSDAAGVFNVTGAQVSFGEFLDACCLATQSAPEIVWVSTADLLAAGAEPWMGVPLWIAVPGWEGANDVDISRALAAGLSFRPLADTIRDTYEWDLSRSSREEGLPRDREKALLDARR